jgi:hypothetical protein
MVVCPNCELGVFHKQGVNIPYMGFVKDIALEAIAAIIIVVAIFSGVGGWGLLAIFLSLHIAWCWVKSGWEFIGGIESP